MCGFAGVIQSGEWPGEPMALLRAMAEPIRHRGPDDEGLWADPAAGIGLAFRRLAILDLTPEGHQPMASADSRFMLVFNGEIYNFQDLRRELEALGHRFRGHSDTEVMLGAFVEWGVEAALPRFWGMFAVACWDRQERRLWLARDRVGKKPLYWGWQGRTFLFGSELKSLRAHPSFRGGVDPQALGGLLRFGYVPGPWSIHPGIHKLPAGHLLCVNGTPAQDLEPRPYWDLNQVVARGLAHPFQGSHAEADEALLVLLKDAVGRRMVADVPVGAFLSGGIDSSLVAALMQAQSPRPVKTFTIGFEQEAYNEAVYAKKVAAHLGTDHTELRLSPGDALAVIPELPRMFDEPFADSSQIPTYLVSRLARTQVTVALSGDGGDEGFGGYWRYFKAPEIWGKVTLIPRGMRVAISRVIDSMGDPLLRGLLNLPGVRGWAERGGYSVDHVKKGSHLLVAGSIQTLYDRINFHWPVVPLTVTTRDFEPRITGRMRDPIAWMMAHDTLSYLPDDILVKVDRASMAVSLEARAPLLDHRVLEFAWSLPLAWKVRDGQGKLPFRRLLHRYVPRALVERPKMGFGVPIEDWLRADLRDWAENLLSPALLSRSGLLDPAPIRRRWHEHLTGKRQWSASLWGVLMFQAWLEDL